MRYRIALLLTGTLLLIGCDKMNSTADSASFRQQLSDLVQMKESGTITEQEYRSLSQQVRSLMMH